MNSLSAMAQAYIEAQKARMGQTGTNAPPATPVRPVYTPYQGHRANVAFHKKSGGCNCNKRK